jgi:hypothetical protein
MASGGIKVFDTDFSTISGNDANSGGGISSGAPQLGRIRNSIIAGNTARGYPSDIVGNLDSQGHNLIGIGDGGSGYADTDLVGTYSSPLVSKLGPLQDNGGPTWTMALLRGSPAIGAGALTDSERDQRGPGYARTVNGRTDIGAYEVQDGNDSRLSAHAPRFPDAPIPQSNFALGRRTMGLLPGTPVIDAGAPTNSKWDQRGPGYPRVVSGATDIGAN